MINGLSFDIEDWFQVENLRSICPFEKWNDYELRVEKNTDLILDLLAEYDTKATFFILGWIAKKRPNLVKKIYDQGHEVASHGYNHSIVYNLSPGEFEDDLVRSKDILEKLTNQPVIGYRAPNFSITRKSLWAIDVLVKHGFKYDSSIFPTSFHDRYGFEGINSIDCFKFENGLQEFPLTIFKFGKINFPLAGGAYFRFIPYGIFKLMLNKINKKGRKFIFYLHPWELDNDQPRVKIKKKYYIRHYTNLSKTESRFKLLLEDFKFQPLKSLLNNKN